MRIAPDLDVDDAALAAVCDRYGIAELKVFGSRARGTAGPGSDIDVLYSLLPGRKLGWEIEQLADELDGLPACGTGSCRATGPSTWRSSPPPRPASCPRSRATCAMSSTSTPPTPTKRPSPRQPTPPPATSPTRTTKRQPSSAQIADYRKSLLGCLLCSLRFIGSRRRHPTWSAVSGLAFAHSPCRCRFPLSSDVGVSSQAIYWRPFPGGSQAESCPPAMRRSAPAGMPYGTDLAEHGRARRRHGLHWHQPFSLDHGPPRCFVRAGSPDAGTVSPNEDIAPG